MPRISVLLPAYNCEAFLGTAIESVLRQTERDLELIVIDDGSTDGTSRVIERAAASDRRVRFYSRPNKGLVETLNEGVRLAHGEWLARMDGDDECLPTRLARQLAHCKQTNLDVCGSAMVMFRGRRSRVRAYPVRNEDIRTQLAMTTAFAHPTVFGRTECFAANPYRADYLHTEDYDLWTRLALAGFRMGNVQEPLLRYRLSPGQISSVHLSKQFECGSAIAFAYRSALVQQCPGLREEIVADSRLADAAGTSPTQVRTSEQLRALAQLLSKLARALGAERPAISEYLCYLARHNRGVALMALLSALRHQGDGAPGRALLAVLAQRARLGRLRALASA